MIGLERLLMLERVLGSAWPFGECPHDHSCVWQQLGSDGQRTHTTTLARNSSAWNILE